MLTTNKLIIPPKLKITFPVIPLASAGIDHGIYSPKLRAEPSCEKITVKMINANGDKYPRPKQAKKATGVESKIVRVVQ